MHVSFFHGRSTNRRHRLTIKKQLYERRVIKKKQIFWRYYDLSFFKDYFEKILLVETCSVSVR